MSYDPEGDWPTVITLNAEMGGDNKLLTKCTEILSEKSDLYADMPFAPCNEGSTHLHLMDGSIPSGTWRRYNTGIRAVTSTSIEVRDTCGWLEARAECDKVLARKSGDVAMFRARQDRRIITGLNEDLTATAWYGDPRTNPLKYFGFAPRYDVLGNPSDKPSANTFNMYHVLSMGGTTTSGQSSIWLIGWGVDIGAFGIYPDTAPNAGIEVDDLGELDLHDSDGKVFRGYATHFRVQQGIAVNDWRNITRICNVEISSTLDETYINNLCDKMIDATFSIPDLKEVRPIFYMNRSVLSMLHKAATRKQNVNLGFMDLYGVKDQLNISKIPIKLCDGILNTEEVVASS